MSLEDRLSRRTRPTLFHLGWQHLLLIMAGLATVLLVLGLASPYGWADLFANEVGIKRFETSFGFRWGRVRVDNPSCPATEWCVVSVVPGGAFSRLGLREGDVPFWHTHGGAWAMYEALSTSLRGGSGYFEVISIHDRSNSLREINVPPLRRILETSPSQADVSHSPPQQTSSCWSDRRVPAILALGREHAPDAHATLKAIASEVHESEGREMARVMLQNWDVKDGSYRSAHAQRIGPFIVPIEEKRKVLPPVIQQTILVFDVLVDDQGCTASVDLLRPGSYPAFANLVLTKVKKLHYVPKKDGENYVAEKFVLSFNQEVN